MGRNFNTVLVGLIDRCTQFLTTNLSIGLEPTDAFLGPVTHDATGVLLAIELCHRHGATLPSQVGPCHENAWSDTLAGVDGGLEVEFLVWRTGTSGADCGHP